MAMRVPTYDRQQVVQASRPVGVAAARPGVGQVAKGVADVGQMFDQWQADVDEGDAKAADTRYSDMVRKTLYEDGSGYLYAQGGDALARRKDAAETLQKSYDEILEGLSPRAREMAQSSLESRRQTALTSVDRHAGGERISYLNGQADARVKSAVEDAIIDPGQIGRSISISRSEISDAGQRNGWAPEVVKQKQSEAEGAIHGGIVARLANVDPQQALDYLNANRGSMSASDVARYESQLIPEAKRRRGREIGRGLAQGAAGGVDDGYYAAIRSAESGGNDHAKNPTSTATGRYQFVAGTWSQLMRDRPDLGLTQDGRTNRAQQERAIRAFTESNARALVRGGVAITYGTLYAAHFLGAGGALKVLTAPMSAAVSDIVGPAVVRANQFLANMSVADFASWAEKKAGGTPVPMGDFKAPSWSDPAPPPPQINPVTQILSMDDPDERAAAMQEYQLWSGQIAAQQKAAQDAAQQAGFAMIESGGDIDSLSLDQKMQIGRSGMNSLREYQSKVRRQDPVQTDDALFVELTRQAVEDPKGFAAQDPLTWRNRLSDADFKSMTQKQADALKPEKPAKPDAAVTISTISTVSKDLLASVGIDDKKQSGAKRIAEFQAGMLRWAQQFQAENKGRAPTHLEIRDRANAMLMPVVVDPPGWNNEVSGNVFDIDLSDITPQQIVQGAISLGGRAVDLGAVEAFATAFQQAMGRAPTPQEVIEGLAWSAAAP